MPLEDYEFDAVNTRHIARHNISPEAVAEALADPLGIEQDAYHEGGEWRSARLGMTSGGRTLVVICTERGGRIRPISARRATPREERIYRWQR